jgi:DNA-directed RNA polymerase specialized sigma24 family protein
MKGAQNAGSHSGFGEVPPFWIRPTDGRGGALDQRVLDASRRLWRWTYHYVDKELHDAPCAAELLEGVALEVSGRLQAEPEVARNLTGYMITGLHHRVLSQLLENNRLVYEGLLRELEENHQLTAPDWTQRVEAKLWLKFFVSFLTHPVQHMLHYRMLGFYWDEIGSRMGLSAKQAKKRFYYGIQKGRETVIRTIRTSTNGLGRQEPE